MMRKIRDLPKIVQRSLVNSYTSGISAKGCAEKMQQHGYEITQKQVKNYFYRHKIYQNMTPHTQPEDRSDYSTTSYIDVGTPIIEAEKIVICSDHQARYDNRQLEISFLKFLRDFQPNAIVVNGDLFDFEALSKFPTSLKNRTSLNEDVKAGRSILRHYREACPQADIYLIEGNHEARLDKYLVSRAPELCGIPGLNITTFLGLEELGVEYVGPYGRGVDWNGVLILHGNRVSIHAAYSAKAEFLDAGTSLVMGHTTRIGAYYLTDRRGTHAAFEDGSMTNIDPEKAPPSMRGPRQNNWQNGFMFGYAQNRLWNLYQVSVTDNSFIWNGKLYTPHR